VIGDRTTSLYLVNPRNFRAINDWVRHQPIGFGFRSRKIECGKALMADPEISLLLREEDRAALVVESRTTSWKPGAIAVDIATLGMGTALAAVFNTLLVFLIPRLVSVEEYGYWRLFLLYAGYAGFLHLGFTDGALLRWVGKPREEIAKESGTAIKFVFLLQIPLLVGAGLLVGLLRRPLNFVGAGILVFALVLNLGAVLQYSTQAARIFKPVAVATAVAPGAFMAMVFLGSLRKSLTAPELIVFYIAAASLVLGYLWLRVRPRFGGVGVSARGLGKSCILAGWPVVLANTGYGLVQSADRLVVSSALPITDFAQYSLAASAMFVPVVAIAAVSRVFLSHAASVEHDDRTKIYGHMSRFLLIAWSLLLPYFFVLEAFVKRFLPRYVVALPVASVLILSVIFLAGIQILHMSYFYLYGKQKQFLIRTLAALVLGLATALALTEWLHSLLLVAVGQVAALGLWWMLNEWSLRRTTEQTWSDWLRVLGVGIGSAASYGLVLWSASGIGWRLLLYYALAGAILWIACGNEIKFSLRIASEYWNS
jgi:O-antigen/teichoic acid export membrane protein